jgi:short-subunit dehydrogenase
MSNTPPKTFVITGGSTGIGRSLVHQLTARGENVVLAARDREALQHSVALCAGAPGRASAFQADVGDPEQCKALIAHTLERFDGIDVLINNAGIATWGSFAEVTDLAVFERVMRVNYLGAVYCTHYALPHLRRVRGAIVAVSSLAGKIPLPSRTGYVASKHAMQGFFDSLRAELRGIGVSVIVVSPGLVATKLRSNALGPQGVPLGEGARVELPGAISAETCARRILRAVDQRERDVTMTLSGRIGAWLRLIAPDALDRLGERALRRELPALSAGPHPAEGRG